MNKKEQIEEIYIDALNNNETPDVFADRILFLFGDSNCFKLGDEITGNGFEAEVIEFPEVEYKMQVKYKHNDAFDTVDPREWRHK